MSIDIISHLSLQVRHRGRWVHEEALTLGDGDSGGARLVLKVLQGLQKEDVSQYRVGFSNLVFFFKMESLGSLSVSLTGYEVGGHST